MEGPNDEEGGFWGKLALSYYANYTQLKHNAQLVSWTDKCTSEVGGQQNSGGRGD